MVNCFSQRLGRLKETLARQFVYHSVTEDTKEFKTNVCYTV